MTSWDEKRRAIEELWDAVALGGDWYESPAWHEQELKETRERHESGAEEPIDWARAKRELRK